MELQKEIRELPQQEVIYEDDLFALDSDESNQTGKITYKQLLDKIRDDIFGEIQDAIDSGGDHDQDQDQQIAEMNAALRGVCNKVYPIGSVYISFGSEDPATIFGGEWERIEDRFLLAKGTIYTELGHQDGFSKVKLTANESGLRAHGHNFTQPTVNGGNTTTSSSGEHTHSLSGIPKAVKAGAGGYTRPMSHNDGTTTVAYRTSGASALHTHTVPNHTHVVSGGLVGVRNAEDAIDAHENMPPYIVVNMWKRLTLATADVTPIPEPEVEPDFERTFTEAQRSVIQGWNNVGSYSYSEAVDLQVGNTVIFSNLALTDMDADELGTFDGEYSVVIGTNSSEETDTVEINERQYKLNIVSFGSDSISVGIIVSDYSDDAETVSTNIRLTGNYEVYITPWNNIDETYQMAVFGDGETTSFRMTPGLIPRVVGVTVYDKYGNDITQEVHSQYSRTTVYTALDHESGESDVVFKTPLLDGYVAVLTFSQE